MASRGELFDRLKCLSPAQFEEVLFHLEIEPWIIPGAFAEQSVRAKAVIQRLEQEQEGLVRLERTLAEPAISIISEQYIGYEIEAQVKRIISEYTQQPFEGREEEKRQLDEFVMNNSSGLLLVTAAAGFGKSALLSHWQQTRHEDCFIAYHCFSYRYEKTRSLSEAYRHLLKQLYLYYNIRNGQFPNDENGMRDKLIGMLGEPVSPEGKCLVIVLDGLDEAEKTFEPFFTGLSDGVFVIASARAEEGDEPEYLRNWTDNAQRLCLKRLPREAIPKWLEQISELVTYAQDKDFVKSLDETTGGFPLYLRFLIDDLRQAATKRQDVQAVVRNSPGGFKAYVKEQFRLLAKVEEIKRQREVQELFALLSVALGALSEDDIQELTTLTAWDLADLPWQATRWFSIQMGFYSFAHPLLADEFQGVLGRQADLAQGKLIDYCAKWQEHHSAYALRYYAEHLGKAKRWEELYAIARDEDFASAQQQQLPDEPDLPLKTVQTALLGAVEEDKAERMAEFVLVNAHRLGQTNAQESPLDALRSGSLKRAWKLADQFEIERCILWYLLLAWELKDEGKLDEARETLERLQEKELPRFQIHWSTQWQSEYAEYLLGHIFEVSEETCIALHQKLFEDAHQALLFRFLRERGDFKAALEITRKAFPNLWWVWSMGQIAKAQMKVGQSKEARATFAEAIETAHQIANPKTRTSILITIANSQADVRLFSDARETLQHIDIRDTSQDYWTSLVEAQAKIGDKEQAIISLNQAKQLALNIEDENYSRLILSRIASKQAEIGELTDALETVEEIANFDPNYLIEGLLAWMVSKEERDERDFTAVLEAANRIYEKIETIYKAKVLKEIVEVQVKKAQKWQEDFTEALTTTRQIKDKRCKAEALLVIVKAQTQLRWFDQALETADIIDTQEEKDQALVAIVQAQATTGQFEKAFTTGSKIQEQSKQEDALLAIANAYAQAKKFSHAIKIANGIFNPFKKVELLKSIAIRQLQGCLAKEARDTLAIGLNTSLGSELSYQQALALLNIADLLLGAGQNEKCLTYAKNAYEIAKKINELSKKVNVLALMGEIYAQAGQRNEAQNIFAEAIEIVQRVKKQNSPNHVDWSIVELFTKIGVAQARSGEFDAALETIQLIQLTDGKALVLKTLAQAHPETEKKEKLKAALTTIYENDLISFNWGFDHQVNILSSIAVARMALDERDAALAIFSEACEIVKQEKTKKFKTNPESLLSTLAAAQAEAGEITLALENAEKIDDGLNQVETLLDIASFQSKKGDKEGLLKTLDAALKAKEKITDEQKQLDALWMIAQIQAMAGHVEQALQTAEQILTNRNQLLFHIATNLIQLKDKDNFKKLLIPCAYSFDTAYKMCGCLAYLYPEKAESVADVVKKFTVSST